MLHEFYSRSIGISGPPPEREGRSGAPTEVFKWVSLALPRGSVRPGLCCRFAAVAVYSGRERAVLNNESP